MAAAAQPRVVPVRYPYGAARGRDGTRAWSLWLARFLVGGAAVISMISALVYYNRLVSLEQEINAARAQIDRELQRRTDLVQNLVPPVFEYAELERGVFTAVAKLRTEVGGNLGDALPRGLIDAPAGLLPQADKLGEIMGRLIAVSEQYPQMKASAPFELLMLKVTEAEDRVAAERRRYNELVNSYRTLACSFPGAVFAALFRFEKEKPFFVVDSAASLAPKVRRPIPEVRP